MLLNGKSTLNPFADSFVPNKKTEYVSMKEIAEKYILDTLEKKENGEKSLTKLEMANIVAQLINLRFPLQGNKSRIKINKYLQTRILSSTEPEILYRARSINFKSLLGEPFDLSMFKPPKPSFLIVSFWGLYRQEQALRPLLSLTKRPDVVKDPIWSISTSDMKLWNQSCVKDVCKCPPIFGYSIPSNFIVDLPFIQNDCPIQNIHLNHYSESSKGNEFVLSSKLPTILDELPFEEDIPTLSTNINIEALKDEFEAVVAGICDLLDQNSDCDSETEDILQEENNFYSFWDDEPYVSYTPISQQNIADLVDDNDHPLLEVPHNVNDTEEVVPLEVKEMIRRCFSPMEPPLLIKPIGDTEEKPKHVSCKPPCSVWCDSKESDKETDSDYSSEESINVDLVSLEQLDSEEREQETVTTLTLKPNLTGRKMRPSFQRSFSVNDGDPSFYESNLGLNGVSDQATSKDMFALLKKDPLNFFTIFNRNNSWKKDSRFISRWSSQDEVCGSFEHGLIDSIWRHVSSDDSLWVPLPECVDSKSNEDKPLSHRRVRDLRLVS